MNVRRYIALVVVLLVASSLFADTDIPRLYWSHEGSSDVTSFQCVVDEGIPVDLGLPTASSGTYSVPLSDCGELQAGVHEVVVRACNLYSCSASAALVVVKL